MPLTIRCPCGRALQIKDEWLGKKVKCPFCSRHLAIPSTQSPPTPKAPVSAPPPPAPSARSRPAPEPTVGTQPVASKPDQRWPLWKLIGGLILLMAAVPLAGAVGFGFWGGVVGFVKNKWSMDSALEWARLTAVYVGLALIPLTSIAAIVLAILERMGYFTDSIQHAGKFPHRWRVAIPMYRDLSDAAALLTSVPSSHITPELMGAMTMTPVAWPPVCVVCSAEEPTETTSTICVESIGSTTTMTIHTRKGIPICDRCNRIRDHAQATSPVDVMLILAAIGLGIFLIVSIVRVFMNDWSMSSVVRLAVAWTAGLILGGVMAWWACSKLTRLAATFPESATLPWSMPIKMTMSALSFGNEDYANRFARANNASVTREEAP